MIHLKRGVSAIALKIQELGYVLALNPLPVKRLAIEEIQGSCG